MDYKDNEISRMAQKYAGDVSRYNEDLRALREDYEVKIKEYEVLMDLKVQLDQEIATYRALLQEEENRWVPHHVFVALFRKPLDHTSLDTLTTLRLLGWTLPPLRVERSVALALRPPSRWQRRPDWSP